MFMLRVALKCGKRWIAEYELFAWCEARNVNGMTPSTAALLCRAREFNDALPAAVRGVDERGRPSNAAKLWAFRWRKRWGARIGKLRVGDASTPEDSRQKVAALLFMFACVMCKFGWGGGLIFGSVF